MALNKHPQQSSDEVLARRALIADLYVKGYRQPKIAEHLGISQPLVSTELKRIREDWLKSSLRDFDQAKAEELARIDVVEREYFQAWERSKRNAETVTEREEKAYQLDPAVLKRKVRDKGKAGEPLPRKLVPTKVFNERRSVGQSGDARYLDGVMACIKLRLQILGVLDEGRTNINIQNNATFNLDDYVQTLPKSPLADLEALLDGSHNPPVATVVATTVGTGVDTGVEQPSGPTTNPGLEQDLRNGHG